MISKFFIIIVLVLFPLNCKGKTSNIPSWVSSIKAGDTQFKIKQGDKYYFRNHFKSSYNRDYTCNTAVKKTEALIKKEYFMINTIPMTTEVYFYDEQEKSCYVTISVSKSLLDKAEQLNTTDDDYKKAVLELDKKVKSIKDSLAKNKYKISLKEKEIKNLKIELEAKKKTIEERKKTITSLKNEIQENDSILDKTQDQLNKINSEDNYKTLEETKKLLNEAKQKLETENKTLMEEKRKLDLLNGENLVLRKNRTLYGDDFIENIKNEKKVRKFIIYKILEKGMLFGVVRCLFYHYNVSQKQSSKNDSSNMVITTGRYTLYFDRLNKLTSILKDGNEEILEKGL